MSGFDILGRRANDRGVITLGRGYASLGLAIDKARAAFDGDPSWRLVYVQRPGAARASEIFMRPRA